jgi:hypothetical protein
MSAADHDALGDAIDRLVRGEPIACALCHNYSCVCPPFGHPAYFVLTDYRHGRITADDPEFVKYFRIAERPK